jgi:hypothetical protein
MFICSVLSMEYGFVIHSIVLVKLQLLFLSCMLLFMGDMKLCKWN